MLCKHCGKENDDHLLFCIHCGKSLQDDPSSDSPIEIYAPTFAPGFAPPSSDTVSETGQEMEQTAAPGSTPKKHLRKKCIMFSVIAVILIAAITIGLLTNWLGFYGPTTKIALAGRRTLDSGSFTATVNISVGRFTLKKLNIKVLIDKDNQDLTVLCTDKNSIIQFAIYDGYYLKRAGLGSYQATDIHNQLEDFFSQKETDWEALLRTLSPEFHETLSSQMDFDKIDKCMISLFRKSNSPSWLKETACLTTSRNQGITTYEYEPDTESFARSCLNCLQPAFHDSDDYEKLLEEWDNTLEQLPPVDLKFTVEKRKLTGCEIKAKISGKDVCLTAELSAIGNTRISEKTLQECLDSTRKK